MRKAVVLFLACMCVIGYSACRATDRDNGMETEGKRAHRPGMPMSAEFADENRHYEFYVNEEEPPRDDFDVAIRSLWLYDKGTGKSSRLFTTVRPEYFCWYKVDGDRGDEYPIDSITALNKVIPYDEDKLIVQGCPDARNDFTYIIHIPERKAILLPCNNGFSGFTYEEGMIICQSYRYVSDPEIAGRYTYLQVFDWDGRQVGSIDLEMGRIRDDNILNMGFGFEPKTKFNLEKYINDSDFRFPVKGDQTCWEYLYSFDELSPEDIKKIDEQVSKDPDWKKTSKGYHYNLIDKEYGLNVDMDIDLKHKRVSFIHGVIENNH